MRVNVQGEWVKVSGSRLWCLGESQGEDVDEGQYEGQGEG